MNTTRIICVCVNKCQRSCDGCNIPNVDTVEREKSMKIRQPIPTASYKIMVTFHIKFESCVNYEYIYPCHAIVQSVSSLPVIEMKQNGMVIPKRATIARLIDDVNK